MPTHISPLAGKVLPQSLLVNVGKLVAAYFDGVPDAAQPAQRVAFGTSGHRGSSFTLSFNEHHVLAITQAICRYRASAGIDGPLFLGIDTHALSQPAAASALEVLAANGVTVMIAEGDEFTPTPAVSHAILTYNRGRTTGRADGIVVTPSHNPPEDGGFKYNPSNGGPAGSEITGWIEAVANVLLEQGLAGVERVPHAAALRASTTHRHDYIGAYVADLVRVVDLGAIGAANVKMGVDPLGGAGVHYWSRIAERYRLNLTVISDVVDKRFGFMTADWDGRIRMDPSSRYAMQRLIDMKEQFDIAFACDTDHDRHGIVTGDAGLLTPNQYLPVAIDYLFRHRPQWPSHAAVGKTVVSTRLFDLVAKRLNRNLYEVPVGFKWFSDGLVTSALGFAGEESAGASFLRRDGQVWTTDKDGILLALLSAEITATTGRDPGLMYRDLTQSLGSPLTDRVEAPATATQKAQLAAMTPQQLHVSELAGEQIESVLAKAPGNGAAIGGIKVMARSGWYAARPSGTEDIYRIYAESFSGAAHLQRILKEAQQVVDQTIGSDSRASP